MNKLGFVILSLLIAACDLRGCSGQSFTLVYTGAKVIDAKAPVLKDEEPIGFVDTAKTDGKTQRLTIRVRDLNQVHERDAYVPYQTENGLTGLQIIHVGGDPLSLWATVYYPPKPDPVQVAQPAEAAARTTAAAQPAEVADLLAADPLLNPARPVIGSRDDTPHRRSVRRTVGLVQTASNWPPDVKRQVDEIMHITLKPGNDVDVLKEAHSKLRDLHRTLATTASTAYHQGDKVAAREAVNAAQQIALLESRMKDLTRRAHVAPLAEAKRVDENQ